MKFDGYKLKNNIELLKPAKEYLDNDFEKLIELFLKYLNDEDIEIYNEDCLKFELGMFLRIVLTEYNVNFEKNVKCFIQDVGTKKHEIDITIYPKNTEKKDFNDNKLELIKPETAYAIELKFPSFKIEKENDKFVNRYNNGTNNILEQMEIDIDFVEELVDNGFKNVWSFVLVPKIAKTIYQFPENQKKAPAEIYYKFREYDNQCIKNNKYNITWLKWDDKGKYYIKSGCKNFVNNELK